MRVGQDRPVQFKNDKIFNSLNAIRQDYQQIIDMLSDNLKIDENRKGR